MSKSPLPSLSNLVQPSISSNMAAQTETVPIRVTQDINEAPKSPHREPLKLVGALDQYKSFNVTPVIGREFPEASLKEWLEAQSPE